MGSGLLLFSLVARMDLFEGMGCKWYRDVRVGRWLNTR
jgi:hypothetical protein